MSLEKTQKDTFRSYTELKKYPVNETLPAFFETEFPKLIRFLETYYEEAGEETVEKYLEALQYKRDFVQADQDLLRFFSQELLLGRDYFDLFVDKQSAIQTSNLLYRSKGSKYSIQQFFRAFFGITPEVRYTKEDRFMIGVDDSRIGPESQKFLTDDKLYQVFAILIKADIPVNQWREAYKLFVHPAGMYFGGEVLLEGIGNLGFGQLMPDFEKISIDPVVQGTATLATPVALTDLTGEVDSDGRGVYGKLRIDLPGAVEEIQNLSLAEIDRHYDSIGELIGTNSPTFDEDSAVGDPRAPRFSSNRAIFDTMDEVKYTWYDSDSA